MPEVLLTALTRDETLVVMDIARQVQTRLPTASLREVLTAILADERAVQALRNNTLDALTIVHWCETAEHNILTKWTGDSA